MELYAGTNGRLYTKDWNGIERIVGAVGDVVVSKNQPVMDTGIWVELNADDTPKTFWIVTPE